MTRGNAQAMRPCSVKPAGFASVMPDRDRSADDVDFFPTRPWGGRAGAEIILQLDPRARSLWECAVGAGHLAHGLKDYFPTVHTSDLCRYDGNRVFDFLSDEPPPFRPDWIATNPPFDHVEEFIRLAWARAGRGVAMLLRGACLEGQARYRLLYEDCPYFAYAPFSERLAMHKGFWDSTRSTATMYAWFFFLKPGVGPRRRPPYPYVIPIPPGTEARLTGPDDHRLFAARDRGGAGL